MHPGVLQTVQANLCIHKWCKDSRTSHLKRHIALGSCPKIKSHERKQLALASGLKIDGESTDPPRRRYRSTVNVLFDQEVSCENLAKMIIVHEYPLHMVEQPAVVSFAQSPAPVQDAKLQRN